LPFYDTKRVELKEVQKHHHQEEQKLVTREVQIHHQEEFLVKVISFGSLSKGGRRKSILVLDDQILTKHLAFFAEDIH
jgi:hypothetical protein